MRKMLYVLSLFLCCAWLAGCGGQGKDTEEQAGTQGQVGTQGQADTQGQAGTEGQTSTPGQKDGQQAGRLEEYTDIVVESKKLFHLEDTDGWLLSLQYYQDEPVALLRNWDVKEQEWEIDMVRADGSKELLIKEYSPGTKGFLDKEGNYYSWTRDKDLVKMDSSGKEVFRISLESFGARSDIINMRQLADDRIVIEYMVGSLGSDTVLAVVDPATGKVSRINTVMLSDMGDIAAGAEEVLYIGMSGIYEIDTESGSKTATMSFNGTSYVLPSDIRDFRMLSDGSVEILRQDENGDVLCDTLQTVTLTTDKAVVTVRCYDFSSEASWTSSAENWLKTQVDLFNKQSEDCRIILDENSEGTEREDFARQTSIELAAGKGPDIFFGDVLGDYVYGAIQKGALADLTPYMEKSGIKEEDYFPAAFDCWKENGGIYGVCTQMSLLSYRIDRDVMGGKDVTDVETLVDALLAWQENAVFYYEDSRWFLEYLLRGSEDIWGMIDWEAGTCDFSGELFAKILEAAKRYGADERNNYPALAESRVTSLLKYDYAVIRDREGTVVAGMLFDDGCYPMIKDSLPGRDNRMFAINANSAHMEEAWEFISYLLGEDVQMTLVEDADYWNERVPVNRKAFDTCVEDWSAQIATSRIETYESYRYDETLKQAYGVHERSYKDHTEEKVAEYREFVESARHLPIRTIPILDIIYEEAEYYFNDTKSIEQVSEIIRNRVQLYMDENY